MARILAGAAEPSQHPVWLPAMKCTGVDTLVDNTSRQPDRFCTHIGWRLLRSAVAPTSLHHFLVPNFYSPPYTSRQLPARIMSGSNCTDHVCVPHVLLSCCRTLCMLAQLLKQTAPMAAPPACQNSQPNVLPGYQQGCSSCRAVWWTCCSQQRRTRAVCCRGMCCLLLHWRCQRPAAGLCCAWR